METKICIAIPTNRGLKARMALSLLNMIKENPYQFHFEIATEGYTIAENRNSLTAKAIKNGCSHILFLDDDMVFPADTLRRLLSHDKDIVGVNYHPRMLCTLYMVGLFGDEKTKTREEDLPKELFKCRGLGFGVILIKTDVFRKTKQPWFDWEKYDTVDEENHAAGMIKMGEDFWFCKRASEAGYDIWCDPTLNIGHIGDYTY